MQRVNFSESDHQKFLKMSEKHKSGSHKKRKHEKRMVSSSSSEEDIPKISSKKEKIEEKRPTPKGPSPESKMKLRIKNYLNANTEKVTE